jgi:hypothetical protein
VSPPPRAGLLGVVLATLLALALFPARARAEGIQVFPLPMYTTVPNEGSTWGVLPVFLFMGDEQRIKAILAPSLSWNQFAGFTATFRYFRYFGTAGAWRFVVSASTDINRAIWYQYDDDRRDPSADTKNVLIRVRRNLFFRYFGQGPFTPESGESSYTRVSGFGIARWGWNFTRNFNVGPFFEVRGDHPEVHTIGNLPSTQALYPNAPGLDGAIFVRQGLSIRYDTRDGNDRVDGGQDLVGDYALGGFGSELDASIAESITGGAGVFGQIVWNTRLLVPENRFLQLAARAYWRQLIGSDNIPFYDQASLGGELLLRGFQEDRFIDKGAWEFDVEQRIRLFELHLFGVVSDWRLDPFVSAGQVYGTDGGPFSRPRFSVGAGLRVWVHPDVLGRIDLADGGEGLRAYVVLGYPY